MSDSLTLPRARRAIPRRAPRHSAAWPSSWTLIAEHPRVLVRRSDLPAIRRRARTTHRRELEALLALAERTAAGELPAAAECNAIAPRLAFLRLITGEKEHAALAARCLEKALEIGVSGDYGAGSFRLQTLACCYDWLRDTMGKKLRERVGRRALEQAQALYDSGEVDPASFFAGHAINQIPSILMTGLALGEDFGPGPARVPRPLPMGTHPHHPNDYVNDVLWRMERMFACYQPFLEQAAFQQSYAYSLAYVGELPHLLQLLESGLGRQGFARHPWFEKAVDWYTWALRSDETFIRFGDYFCREGIFTSGYAYRAMAAIASRYRSKLARWWTDRFQVRGSEIDAFVFDDRDGVRAEGPERLPRTRMFAPMGIAIARGDFADGTVAAFKCSPVYLHNHCHRDQNSLVVYHKGEQAIDAGAYDGYESPHWKNYYIRTIAHNSLVVHDPDEWMSMRGWPLANDGGQRFVNTPDFAVRRADQIAQECFRDGRVAGYREGEGWSYACGDASNCYRKEKLTRFLRHVVFVLDWPRPGAVSLVVLDEVELARDGLVPRILLHTVDQPTVVGGRVGATQGGGRLTMHTLLPERAKLETIGGPGRECWVDGRNYPVDPDGDENHGRHARWHAPGSWRVEVSPTDGQRRTDFLTVWNPADRDAPAEPAPTVQRVAEGWIVTQGDLGVGLFRPGMTAAVPGKRTIAVELAR